MFHQHLPFVHDASIVIHEVSAEGAKLPEALIWDFFWHKHDALQTQSAHCELMNMNDTDMLPNLSNIYQALQEPPL